MNDDKYKFTGKERDVETGYDYFGARYYDSRIGRWLQVDPPADKYPEVSCYNYTLDNPLKFIDPNGLAAAGANPTDKSTNKNENQTTDKNNNNNQNAKKKESNSQKATTTVYSIGGSFSIFTGFNFNVGISIDDKTGDSYLFGRWGMSLGFEASVGISSDVIDQHLESTRADGEGYKVDPKGNSQQLEVNPLPFFGFSANFGSRNDGTSLQGFGESLGFGFKWERRMVITLETPYNNAWGTQ